MARLNWIIFVQNVQKITLELNVDDKLIIKYVIIIGDGFGYPKIGFRILNLSSDRIRIMLDRLI